MNLLEIIKNGEKENIEFKESFCDEAIISLTAFANTKGGRVFIGIKDNKEVKGIEVGKRTYIKFINEIKQKTDFKITPEIEEVVYKNKKILVLAISEYPSKPIPFGGRYYKRIKNSNHQMNIDEIAEEYMKARNRSWDMMINDDYSLNDLDFDKVSKIVDRINERHEIKIAQDPLAFLKKFDLISGDKITNAAVLLFSIKPSFLSEIQIGLFENETTIKKDLSIKTDLVSEVEMVLDFIKIYITKEYIISGRPEREEKWQYPITALREFVINAIVHKNYSALTHSQFKVFRDKIVLWNPGMLQPGLEIADLYAGTEKSYVRNMKIAEIFKEIGLIERYGSGIKRAVEEIMEHGLSKPVIRQLAGGVDIEISGVSLTKDLEKENGGINTPQTTPQTTPQITPQTTKLTKELTVLEKKIFLLIKKNNKISRSEISKELNIGQDTVKEYIEKLKNKGYLKRIGPDFGGSWQIIK